ncbi:MAG: GntR family transcriptional regulator [Alphaproteobacteria bacterium]|nr:GntR family transcriptional regulator [Alphaproteobacteria bacterium]
MYECIHTPGAPHDDPPSPAQPGQRRALLPADRRSGRGPHPRRPARAGARLPSVRDLAKALLVSLITVRRAYAELEQAGLIDRRQGQGTFVSEDVRAASRKHALAEAEEALTEGVVTAVQLGMAPEDVRRAVDEILDDELLLGGTK